MVDDASAPKLLLLTETPLPLFFTLSSLGLNNSMHLTWPLQHAAEECCQLGKGEGE